MITGGDHDSPAYPQFDPCCHPHRSYSRGRLRLGCWLERSFHRTNGYVRIQRRSALRVRKRRKSVTFVRAFGPSTESYPANRASARRMMRASIVRMDASALGNAWSRIVATFMSRSNPIHRGAFTAASCSPYDTTFGCHLVVPTDIDESLPLPADEAALVLCID